MENQKNIPVLHFPEFSGNWEDKSIGEITIVTTGGTPSTLNPEYWGGNIRWMNSGELNLKRVFEVKNRITEFGLKNSSTKLIPKKCILIGLAGQGKTRGTIAMNMIEVCTNQSIASILPNEKIYYHDFLYHNLDNRYDELRSLSTGDGGRGGLNLQIIKSLVVCFPSLPEQTKIATFLTSIDERLNQLKQKKTLLEQYKKGVMQKIFDQEIRFKDDDGNEYPNWKMKMLGDMSKITTGKLDANAMVEDGKYRFYTCAKSFYRIDKYSFNTEALLISGNGANVGYIHYYKGKFNAYQRTYILDGFIEDIIFVKYYLEQFLSSRIDIEKKEGNTPYIVLSTLSEMDINLPCITEQTKIANFLSAIDEKINQCTSQIEKTTQYKKGLLQQMFV